jgi:hypothetical protein
MAFGVIAFKFARATYAEICNQIFSPEVPLMDSAILDLSLRKSVAILVVVVLVALVIKEKKLRLLSTDYMSTWRSLPPLLDMLRY